MSTGDTSAEAMLRLGPPPVVVGVDGSTGSWRAVHAAAWEAGERGVPLVLAHGYTETFPYSWFAWSPVPPFGFDIRVEANRALQQMADGVRGRYPGLTVGTYLQAGSGAGVLTDVSPSAALVVVGSRGAGGFLGLSLGSVAAQTAAHARAPVIVIRSEDEPGTSSLQEPAADPMARAGTVPRPGPVLVGVDGSPVSDAAIDFAFQEAALRGVQLMAMHVWWRLPEHNLGPDVPGHYDADGAHQEAQRLLAEMLAGWSSKFPDVPVEQREVLSMNPSLALIEASADAGLVVVGSRGRGGFTGLLLGSVGRDLVGHAHSPVAVVPPRRS
jgi:nucleotide-binding universal stress UspA family protein